MKIKIEISARHVHLNQHDLEILFGEGYRLTKEKDLSQPGQYAAKETLTIVGEKRQIENVRVLGPCRNITQVEIARSDAFYLGCNAPLRLSGKVIGSGAIKLVGPVSELNLKEGAIVAKRHMHTNPIGAKQLGVTNGQNIKVALEGPRAVTFDQVEVRVDEDFETAIHLDTDEANAAGLMPGDKGDILTN